MFHWLFKKRVHESLALAAMFAAGLTLHLAWIINLLAHRDPVIAEFFTLHSDIGPLSGLYLNALIDYLIIFSLAVYFWRGKDLSKKRSRVFWFFVTAVALFFVLTMPIVYQFGIVIQ